MIQMLTAEGDPLAPCYFEGFPSRCIFGYYGRDDRRWSAEFRSDQQLWTAIFLVMRARGAAKPLVWQTEESHRRELGLDKDEV